MQDHAIATRDLTATLVALRDSIIRQALAEGRSDAEATAFADQVMATPPRFEVPGFDAL